MREIPGHNVAMSTLGTIILWYCWYGFNSARLACATATIDRREQSWMRIHRNKRCIWGVCSRVCSCSLGGCSFLAQGSTLKASGHLGYHVAGRAAINTTVAACTSGIACFLFYRYSRKDQYNVSAVCNAILSGLVAVTAPCGVVEPWAAMIIGACAFFVYEYSARLLVWARIDDPLNAAPVHLFCGCWGMLSVGLFATEDGVRHYPGKFVTAFAPDLKRPGPWAGVAQPTAWGLFYGGGP